MKRSKIAKEIKKEQELTKDELREIAGGQRRVPTEEDLKQRTESLIYRTEKKIIENEQETPEILESVYLF